MISQFRVQTQKDGWVVISELVNHVVLESGVNNGICNIFIPHSTASLVATSHWDEKGIEDIIEQLKIAFPARTNYCSQYSPFISAARSKNAVTGSSLSFIIKDAQLLRGSSQALILLEHDGPQERTIFVSIIENDLSYSKLSFRTKREDLFDLEEQICAVVAESGVKNGVCHISNPSSTSGLLLCHRKAAKDLFDDLERLIPARGDFKHRETASDASGHIRASVSGTQLHFPISDGILVKSNEAGIYYLEFDGPRNRSVSIAIYEHEGGEASE